MEQSEKIVCKMDSAPDEIEVPHGTTLDWHKQDDSRIATAGSSPILPMTLNTTETSPAEWEFVTYREIPYEPGDFWDELRKQTPVQNIVVTSSRLRALNPRIFTDFDENADKSLMEHDETENVLQDSSDNEEYAATSVLNEETIASQPNYYRRKESQSSYSRSDSEIDLSPESISFKDSDYPLNSSLLNSDSDNDSDGWVSSQSKKARGKGARRRRTRRIKSSSGSSDLLDKILSGRESPESDDSSLNTSCISDSSVSGILDSDDDLF